MAFKEILLVDARLPLFVVNHGLPSLLWHLEVNVPSDLVAHLVDSPPLGIIWCVIKMELG